MSVSLAPSSRRLPVSALVCAAVMSFFMPSASPVSTQVDNGVKRDDLRSLYSAYHQDPPLHAAPPPKETGGQTGANSETRTRGYFSDAPSVTDHQSNRPQFSYDQNGPHNNRPGTGTTEVWRGHIAGGMKPTSSTLTRQWLAGPQPRVDHSPINRNANNYPPVVRKFPQREAGAPVYQAFLHVWLPEKPQKLYKKAKYIKVHPAKAAGDQRVWISSHSSLSSPPNGGCWTTQLPAPRGRYSGYKETNELAAAGLQATSNTIQSSGFLSFGSQTAPRAQSVSQSLDAAVIKSNPGPEKPASSITGFSQGMNSESSSETQRRQEGRSYLFKGSQTSIKGCETITKVTSEGARAFPITPHEQQTSAARRYSGLSSSLRRFQQSQQQAPSKDVQHPPNNVRPHLDTTVAHYRAQTHSFTTHPPAATVSAAAQTPTPASGETLESFASSPDAGSQDSDAPSRQKPAVVGPVNKATNGSRREYKPAKLAKRLYGFRGFEKSMQRAAAEPHILSSRHGTGIHQYSFNRKVYKLKTANAFSSLSPNYSFRLWGASTAATAQAKPEVTATHSSSPSSGFITQTTSVSAAGSFSSGLKEERNDSKTHMDLNQNHGRFRNSKKIYGLKGFDSRPLEGAEALVGEPDRSATLQQDVGGFDLRSSQIWQPESGRTWYNHTGEAEQGPGKTSAQSPNKPQSKDFKSLLKAAGSIESVQPGTFPPDTNEKSHNSVQDRDGNDDSNLRWRHAELHAPTESRKVSPASLTPAGGLAAEPRTKSEPERQPVATRARLLGIPTSSVVRGRRVKGQRRKPLHESVSLSNNAADVAILRLPRCPTSVTHASTPDDDRRGSSSKLYSDTQAKRRGGGHYRGS